MSTVEQLWECIQAGRIDSAFPETTVEDGQRMQLELLDKWRNQGEELGGYKIGLTSGAARDMFGPGIRPFGYILKSRIHRSGALVNLADIGQMGVENELVFRVGRDIKSDRATRNDARAAIDGVAPGFELNQLRLVSDQSQGIRVAENLSQWGIVAGEFIHLDQDYDALKVTLTRDNEVVQETQARDHIDHHFDSIASVINRLHRFGLGLSAGQLLITGSYTRQSVTAPGKWRGDFGAMGSVEITVI